MKVLKKIMRISAMVLLIILASFGLGINGAILPNFRRDEISEVKIELVESEEEEEKENELKVLE